MSESPISMPVRGPLRKRRAPRISLLERQFEAGQCKHALSLSFLSDKRNSLDIVYQPGVYGFAGKIDVELALNLVWLLLAGLCLLGWGALASRFPGRRRMTAGIALICVIVFLFPVISATDDLTNAPAVCETSKLKKWVSADIDEALLCSAILPMLPQPEANGRANRDLAAPLRAPEVVWSGLERRPPPQVS